MYFTQNKKVVVMIKEEDKDTIITIPIITVKRTNQYKWGPSRKMSLINNGAKLHNWRDQMDVQYYEKES